MLKAPEDPCMSDGKVAGSPNFMAKQSTAEDSHSGTVSAPHDEQSRICERLWDPRLSAL